MATAYTNLLGSGDRVGQLKVTTDLNILSRNPDYLIDGISNTSSFWFENQTVAGKNLEFRIVGSPRVIDAFKIYQGTHSGTPSFKFQGYNGTTWTDLTTFNWPTASGMTEFTFTNTTAYRRYRFLGVSGSINNGSVYEIEFSTQSADAYEVGSRSASITVTASGITTSGGSVQNLVDGDESKNTTHSWFPTGGQAVTSSSIIKFALAAAKTLVSAKIRMSSNVVSNNGTWKWQGSNDDSTWIDVSDPFVWSFPSSTTPSDPVAGFCFFPYSASYSYYRLVGVSGSTSGSPWYMEILFDAGPAPDWPSALRIAGEASGVLSTGSGSTLRVAGARVGVLSQGPGSTLKVAGVSASALVSLGPGGELAGDTNAGVYDNITEFGGDDGPPDALLLDANYLDEGEYDAEINVSVGNPWVVNYRDDSEYSALRALELQVDYLDDSTYSAEIGSLPPPTTQLFMLVTGR